MSLANMKARLEYHGGAVRQDRMIQDKLKSMVAAISNSYQAAKFQKYPGFEQEDRGLFNPVNITERFDTKMISIPFDSGYKVGDIFRWVNTDTVWIIFLQEFTELAYFRGECRRCDHQIHWIDGNQQKQSTYVSVMGPSNPSLRTMASTSLTAGADFPTGSIRMLVQDNEEHRKFFGRYQEMLLQGIAYTIENLDTLSMPGILQLYATEKAANLIEDDVEESVRNAWNVLPVIDRHPTDLLIEGPAIIKPFEEVKFSVPMAGGTWLVVENEDPSVRKANRGARRPVDFIDESFHPSEVTLKWNFVKSGNFTLAYKMPNGQVHQRHIIVGSLM